MTKTPSASCVWINISRMIVITIALSSVKVVAQDPTVSNLRVEQRAGTKLVDILYDLDSLALISVTVSNGDQAVAATSLTGDVGTNIYAGIDRHITWDAGSDWNDQVTTSMVFSVTASPHPQSYMVIDLSGGSTAPSYPVSYMASIPPGGWTDEYRTRKLVLRRIPAGTFMMGSPGELGDEGDEQPQHEVTLTQDYYIGVFEVTQEQWARVVGYYPGAYSNLTYRDTRPVERVSYYAIREIRNDPRVKDDEDDPAVSWPQNSNVNANSFMGRLRSKTGLLTIDLPTEAQWEYACRAGTTTALNSGLNLTNQYSDSGVAVLGRYLNNHPAGSYFYDTLAGTSNGTAKVGSYSPNAWGLYDMHGNVYELCLDRFSSVYYTANAETNPVGPAIGIERSIRGGAFWQLSSAQRSAERDDDDPANRVHYIGLRIARTLP